MTREELRNAISNACDIMRCEGLTTMDYMEQLSWLLFLKSFEETENNRILAGDLFAPPPPAVAGEGELW